MSRMTITEIEVFLLKKPLASSMHISRGGFQVRQHALVKVHTDSGITGLGEGIGNAPLIKTLIDSHLGPETVGMDPMNVERLRDLFFNQPVYFERKGSVVCAASAIEMACWDIKGKALGQSIHQMLGGAQKRIRTYIAGGYYAEGKGLEELQEEADPGELKPLMRLLFEHRIELAQATITAQDLEGFQLAAKLLKEDVAALPEDSISVKEKWKSVQTAKVAGAIEYFDANIKASLPPIE